MYKFENYLRGRLGMKLSLLAGVAVSAMLLAAPQASANGYKPYVSVFGGASVLTQNPHIDYSTSGLYSYDILMNSPGYVIGGAVGVEWGNHVRTELELSHARWSSDKYRYYDHHTVDGGTTDYSSGAAVSATYLLGNAWLDLNQGSRITPYIGGGAGIGWANLGAFQTNYSGYDFSATGFAFQLGAGVRINVSDKVVIDAGYRYKDIVGLKKSPQ